MKDLDIDYKERTGILKKIGPGIARDINKALQALASEKIIVEFTGVQTFDQNSLVVDVGEKCFGSYVNFKSSEDNLEGIAVAIFPLSSTKSLTELLLKRYLKRHEEKVADHSMKLSAFKEGLNILLMTYITGISNALKVKVETDVPKLVSLHNLKFIKSALFRRDSRSDSLISLGQFKITVEKSKNLAKFNLLILY